MAKEDPNTKLDHRHHMVGAHRDPNGVDCVRCKSCLTLLTQWEIRRLGHCRTCKGTGPYNGAYPNPFEMIRLQILNLSKHWVMHGPEGWGWKNAKLR